MPKRIYQAIPKFEKELQQEILLRQETILEKWGPLYLVQSSSERQTLHWAQNIWENAEVVSVESIQKAAQMLKSLHPLWVHFPLENIRRGELVSQALPRIKAKPLQFLESRQLPPLGHFSFLSKDQMLLGYPAVAFSPAECMPLKKIIKTRLLVLTSNFGNCLPCIFQTIALAVKIECWI
jgi:hypothetical protein